MVADCGVSKYASRGGFVNLGTRGFVFGLKSGDKWG